MKPRRKSSSHDTSRDVKYLDNVPIQERLRAEIIRESAKADSHVRIIRNGVETYNSRKK